MTHAQLRIVSEIFNEGLDSYGKKGYLDFKYAVQVDNAKRIAFEILRDSVDNKTNKEEKTKWIGTQKR